MRLGFYNKTRIAPDSGAIICIRLASVLQTLAIKAWKKGEKKKALNKVRFSKKKKKPFDHINMPYRYDV